MKFVVTILASLISLNAFAVSGGNMNYKKAECSLTVDGSLVKTVNQPLMNLMIDDRTGRFAQIQFGDAQKVIQYQLLIENDLQNPSSQNVIVLQNLRVGELESSSEFSAKDVNWLRIAQGAYSVTCNLK
ncbi:hypothetical protein D3C87_1699160 [compost metagenome]